MKANMTRNVGGIRAALHNIPEHDVVNVGGAELGLFKRGASRSYGKLSGTHVFEAPSERPKGGSFARDHDNCFFWIAMVCRG
jgi:hypothetical protein